MNKHLLFIILLIFNFNLITSQIQEAQDIDGDAVWDQFGSTTAISANGSRVAIGSSRNAGAGVFYGQVKIYENDGVSWVQLGDDIKGTHNYNGLGHKVSISADGNRVAISTQNSLDTPTQLSNFSEVLVYEYNGSSWTQIGQNIRGKSISDLFGNAISLSDDGVTLAIGADKRSTGATGLPYVQVYKYISNSWVQTGQDLEGTMNSAFGNSVSLSFYGDRLAVGITQMNLVYAYEFNGTIWVRLGQDLIGENTSDQFGAAVSMSDDGNKLAVGAHVNGGNGLSSGHVRVFDDGGSTWNQMGDDIDGESVNDISGTAISLSSDGETVAIGAYRNDGNGDSAGHTRIYRFNSVNWQQLYSDIDGESPEDESGFSVSLSANGNRVAIGAPNNDGNGENSGHVRVYNLIGTLSNNEFESNNEIILYPNPASDIITIDNFLNYGSLINIQIIDSNGRIIKKIKKNESQIDISTVSNGFYIVKMFFDKQTIVKTFVKQ